MPTFSLLLAFLTLAFAAHAAPPRVAAVASDDAALAAPAARDDSLTSDQILGMVRLAVDRVGGMAHYVPPDARSVLLKPNVTLPKPSGSGIVTDTRVVRAVAILVHEVAPRAQILVGEASGGWIEPVNQDCSLVDVRDDFVKIEDGWEVAGHRQTLGELLDRGIDVRLVDLNLDPVDTLHLADGFADSIFFLPRSITRADAWINLPVAKPHGSKITACIKNRFGILPGWIYGYGKSAGTDRHRGINHTPQILDEILVDILRSEPEDLCVCDMIRNTEGGAFSGEPRRTNAIVAGSDGVSTDLVTGRIMGFNPDDFEFADLAYQRGFGPRFIERIDVDSDVPTVEPRFIKAGADYGGGDWAQQADFGMGVRRWILKGPLPRDHRFTDEEFPRSAEPGVDGWSGRVFFGHDRIDLDRYYDDPTHCAVYAYTTFTMAADDSVRYWIGSDDAMSIWIDGELIYEHTGRRRHVLGGDRLAGFLMAGTHELLVRVEQVRGRFDFSLNICEPMDDDRYAGNRYPGVRYAGEDGATQPTEAVYAINRWDSGDQGRQRFDMGIDGLHDPLSKALRIPDEVRLDVSAPSDSLMLSVVAAAGGAPILSDTAAVRLLAEFNPWFAYQGFGYGWAPEQRVEIDRFLAWMGLDFAISYGYGGSEAHRTAIGWIAQGRPVIFGDGLFWYLLDGYRHVGDDVEFRRTTADSTWWAAPPEAGWARMGNGFWAPTPMLVVQRREDPIPTGSLVDSLVAITLDDALTADVIVRSDSWGQRRAPAGLAAWDAWITDWERRPWTRNWAASDWPRKSLVDRRRSNGFLQHSLDHLARLYAWAAALTGDPHLDRAAAAYARGAAWADSLQHLLPETKAGTPAGVDAERYARIEDARGFPRRARTAVREALAALAERSGRTLPPIVQDPLRNPERGVKVATWSAARSKAIYELAIGPDRRHWTHLVGREVLDPHLEVLTPVPPGWRILIEHHEGEGVYTVDEQPTETNDWTARVLVDDDWAPFANSVSLSIWAFPPQ